MRVTEEYRRYIKSERWKAKREQVFARYGKRCFVCKTIQGHIQIHHLTYDRLFNENLSDLRPLCVKCHKEVGELHWKLGKRMDGRIVFSIFMRRKRSGK